MPKNWCFELWCWRKLLRVPWTARRSNQSILRTPILGVHWKDCCWIWNFNTLTTWCEGLTHLKRPWCWERLKVGGDERGGDAWMALLTQWTWVWVNSGSWWWTGRPGFLQSMGSQWVGHSWETELNWTMKRQGNICICMGKKSWQYPFIVPDGFQVCKCEHSLTTPIQWTNKKVFCFLVFVFCFLFFYFSQSLWWLYLLWWKVSSLGLSHEYMTMESHPL